MCDIFISHSSRFSYRGENIVNLEKTRQIKLIARKLLALENTTNGVLKITQTPVIGV